MIKLGRKVMVSDPCYGMGTWCQGVIDNVLHGPYVCNVEYSDEGEWGMRVAAIQVNHEDYQDFMPMDLEDFVVGVDSGQAGIFDYEFYNRYHKSAAEYNHINDAWYDMVCNITLSKKHFGEVSELGCVSSSGFGDGSYNCYTARNEDGLVVAIRIEFIVDDCEDED